MTDTQPQHPPQDQWFYTIKGEQSGPVSEFELIEMHNTNFLCDSDLVWSLSMKTGNHSVKCYLKSCASFLL